MPSPLFIVLLVGLGIALVQAIRRLTIWQDIAATTLGCLAALVGFAMLEARSKRDR